MKPYIFPHKYIQVLKQLNGLPYPLQLLLRFIKWSSPKDIMAFDQNQNFLSLISCNFKVISLLSCNLQTQIPKVKEALYFGLFRSPIINN